MSSAFLIIDQQPISLAQALGYLQVSGHLQPFLLEILHQHVLSHAVKSQVAFSPAEIEQRLIEFRMDYQLMNADEFQRWLIDRGTDYETFRQQFVWDIAVETLKDQICQPNLQAVFLQRKSSFDRVVLSWIGVSVEAEVQSLQQQIAAGEEFEQLVDCLRSQQPDTITALSEVLTWEELPEVLREAIQKTPQEARLGALIGPVAIDDYWYLVQLEDWLPAELDEELEAHLADEIFEQWLTEKVEAMTVQLSVK
ncbi:MAG: hypothetical protein KME13_25485 [Myxacorys californica WJT36-NPBG1]|jgi:hypothetical protein|nr:hypothetical protein [Myxacorys californica WJT36-NPBG1]